MSADTPDQEIVSRELFFRLKYWIIISSGLLWLFLMMNDLLNSGVVIRLEHLLFDSAVAVIFMMTNLFVSAKICTAIS